jgi:hypothetical protein
MDNWMKPAVTAAVVAALALALTGCGNAMRDYLERPTPGEAASVRQDLTMPPDLRLPPPGTTAPAPDPGMTAPASAAPAQTAAVSPVTQGGAVTGGVYSIYEQAGISLYKPDGTKKTDAELRHELQAYYTARKRQQNPNYGTVFNMGNIFRDE